MAKTSISWCDWTINFIKWYCSKHSAGCENCYMFEMAKRWPQNWASKPVWRPQAVSQFAKIPKGAFVFVGDMYDQYHEDMPVEWIQCVHNLAGERQDLQIMLLTKRIERVAQLAPRLLWPDNLWLGVTVERIDYTWRIDYLRELPAKTKFLSCEPLLGDLREIDLSNIDMAIVGAESGNNRRPFDKQWARNILSRSREYGAAFFYKQSSGMKPGTDPYLDGQLYREFPRGLLPLKYRTDKSEPGKVSEAKPYQMSLF